MNIEGAWKVEMLGPYGWEKVSTAFLQGGRYLAAGADFGAIEVRKQFADTAAWERAVDAAIDRAIDERSRRLGEERDGLVIDARLAWYFVPHSIKVFLDVTLEVAAGRRTCAENNRSAPFNYLKQGPSF